MVFWCPILKWNDGLVCSGWHSYSHGISWKATGTVKWTRLDLILRFLDGKSLKKVEVELVPSSSFLCFLLLSHYLCLAAKRLCVGAARVGNGRWEIISLASIWDSWRRLIWSVEFLGTHMWSYYSLRAVSQKFYHLSSSVTHFIDESAPAFVLPESASTPAYSIKATSSSTNSSQAIKSCLM